MKDRAKRSDSVEAQVAADEAARRGYEVPEGLKALTKREKTAWRQYCLCRSSWNEAELRQLHRLVKQETKFLKMEVEANRTPYTYEKSPGVWVEHPIHVAVRNTEKLLHAQLRIIGLNTSAERAVGTSRNAKLAIPKGERTPEPRGDNEKPKARVSLIK